MSVKRYYHGVVRWQVDPDFEEAPDGDVVLWDDHERELASANALLARALHSLKGHADSRVVQDIEAYFSSQEPK